VARLRDWSDFKKRVEELLDTGSVHKLTASTCRTLLEKGDRREWVQTKIASQIKIMLEDSPVFPEEWKADLEKQDREDEEFQKVACEECGDYPREENSKFCEDCIREKAEQRRWEEESEAYRVCMAPLADSSDTCGNSTVLSCVLCDKAVCDVHATNHPGLNIHCYECQ